MEQNNNLNILLKNTIHNIHNEFDYFFGSENNNCNNFLNSLTKAFQILNRQMDQNKKY